MLPLCRHSGVLLRLPPLLLHSLPRRHGRPLRSTQRTKTRSKIHRRIPQTIISSWKRILRECLAGTEIRSPESEGFATASRSRKFHLETLIIYGFRRVRLSEQHRRLSQFIEFIGVYGRDPGNPGTTSAARAPVEKTDRIAPRAPRPRSS